MSWLTYLRPRFLCFPESKLSRPVLIPTRCLWSQSLDGCTEKEKIFPSEDDLNKLPNCWSQPKVVIIGAGIAGLSAAHKLFESGICDVTVLEATDRPGGRIQSCKFNKSIAELGASVIKGACVANSAYNLAVKEQLLQSPAVKPKSVFYTSRGDSLSLTVSMKGSAAFRHIEKMAMTAGRSDISHGDRNLAIFMSNYIRKEIEHFPDSEKQSALMVMNAYLTSLKEKIGGKLGCVETYASIPSIPVGDIKITSGFVGMLAPLIRDLPDFSIRYCKPVECIQWNPCETEKPRACVQCADEKVFPADYVIITTPLGFLKDKAKSFFVPNLSAKKMNAIKSLGFGHMNKIYLKFPEPIRLQDEGDIMFAWHPDDYDQVDSWVKGLSSLTIEDDSEQIFSGVVAGKKAATMEVLKEDQILSDVQKLMRCFLSFSSIPKASKMLRSKWSTNVYTQGAFTYITTESDLEHIEDLADPTPEPCEIETPVLFFAGEHTSPDNYATVHGARDSGIREANRIINYTKQLKGAPSKQ